MYMLDIEDITTRIRPYLSDTIVKRGWNYYLDRVIMNLTKKEMGFEAIVVGTTSYRVKINLFEFASSSCTCPFDDYCKHMAAVIFEALDKEGLPPIEFLHPKMIRKANQLPSLKVIKGGKSPEIIGPKESDSIEAWHQFFAAKMDKRSTPISYSFDSYYRLVKNELNPYSQSWVPAKKWLYRLHVWLFLTNRIEELYGKESSDYYFYDNMSFKRNVAMEWLHEFVTIVSNLDEAELRDQYEPYLLSTIDYLAQHAFQVDQTITDWSLVYNYLWNRLLFNTSWVNKEMQRLQKELARPQSSEIRQDALKKALLYFEIISGNDQQAMELAETLHSEDASWCFPHLHSFTEHEEWSRLIAWLTWMKPKIKESDRGALHDYLHFWQIVGQGNHVEESEWEQTLVYLLPTSSSDYAHYLMTRGKYQQWVDLHLFYEVSPSKMRSGELKEIETHDRRLLLPLYHQAAERYILEKNRDSYKMAVKMLKKLKTHYKKLKDESRWEHFIETLSAHYKRLRAFQEELQKGKLIP